MIDDTDCSLDELRASRPVSIISELISIQECQEREGRDFSYLRSLRCLSVCSENQRQAADKTLYHVTLPEDDGNFAAVSYVWQASAFEDPKSGEYTIKSRSGQSRPAKVRSSVLERVINYVVSQGVSNFWVDQECINQRNKRTKYAAMQTMDVVYRRSHCPIGMLSTPLRHQEEVDNLYELLQGNFVWASSQPGRLSLSIDSLRAEKVILILFRVLCDAWWSRRWIFQEEYCAMGRMRLLIPHRPGLDKPKNTEVLGDTANELAVSASNFRVQVTSFCIACLDCDSFEMKRSRRRCFLILKRAKSYMVLRKYGRLINDMGSGLVMSTRILADLCRRSGSIPSDMLAIMANSCGYATRFQTEKLQAAGFRSLSLAILALFVLNGEIFQNFQEARDDTVLNFIKRHSLQGFNPPRDDRHLTFMKRCRLPSVVLCPEGMETYGYVWQTCNLFKPMSVARRSNTSDDWRVILEQITHELPIEHRYLKRNLKNYLHGVYPQAMSTPGLQKTFRNLMETVVQAAKDGRRLALARLPGYEQASAMFVWKGRFVADMSIFTAYEPADDEKDGPKRRFLDKFVSLLVDLNRHADSDIPRLRPRGWLNGIWFPGSSTNHKVVFPWPESLRGLKNC